MPTQDKGVLRAAASTGSATFISRILGLVREQVFAYLFGAGNAMDAFNVAFRIPNLLRDLFAEGAMSASLVPTFVQARTEAGERRGWRVAGLVFRVLFVSVSVIAAIGILLASPLVSIYAPAFKMIPGKFELTVRMTRTLFPFFPLVALAAAFMGILNACGYFFLPAFASALFNFASIVVGGGIAAFLFQYGGRYGIQPIEGMAVGVVVGGFVQAFCQLPTLYRSGYRWFRRESTDPIWHQDPYLRKMLIMMVPGTLGLAATQINILVNTILATSSGPGAVSWLNYANRLMQFPIGIFGVAMATATLPRVSQQWVNHKFEDVSETLIRSLRQVFAINIPAAAGLIFLGVPIIQLIFQYGAFFPEDAQKTAMALAMYSLGLVAYSAVKVLVPACYAMGNTRIPVISSVGAVSFTILLNLLTVKHFGFWVLALGTSVGAVLNFGVLIVAIHMILKEKGSHFPIKPLLKSFFQNLAVAVVMGAACFWSYRLLDTWFPDAFFIEDYGRRALVVSRGLKVGLVMVEGLLLFVGLGRIFGLEDIKGVSNLFIEKLKKKLRRSST